MLKLPHWVVTNKFPALYDTESATAIEMVAKLYGKMNELIDDYNNFVDALNAEIEKFENETDKDIELFKIAIRQEFQDFIDIVELKLQSQDKEIADAIAYMKSNLQSTISMLVKEMRENGELTDDLLNAFDELNAFINNFSLTQEYNGTTEELTIKVVNGTSIEKEIIETYEADNETLSLSLQ